MNEADVYRVMYKSHDKQEWIILRSRNRGDGFYARLDSAKNAVKQTVRYVMHIKIQKLDIVRDYELQY